MSTSKILAPAQAEAVYSAMCALNNVGVRVECAFTPNKNAHPIKIMDTPKGVEVRRYIYANAWKGEAYKNQAAFAAAYGLD